MGGIEAVAMVVRRTPGCRVLLLSVVDDEEYIGAALRAGAIGYLLTDIAVDDLRRAVRLAHDGVASFGSPIGRRIVRTSDGGRLRTPTGSALTFAAQVLTSRELQVLRLIAEGATNREIADRLVLSDGTVKNHVSNILARLGLRSRTQAAAVFAHDHNHTPIPGSPE